VKKGPSEAGRLAAPVIAGLDWIHGRLHWWLGLLLIAYLGSGVRIVGPDEVALVLRFGALAGATPAEQVHGPGLLIALPKPMDEVLRVPVARVFELEMRALHWDRGEGGYRSPSRPSIDPETEGYLLTGDNNLLHAVVVARYQISDPVAWSLYQPDHERLLRNTVISALVRTAGEMPVDAVLAEGRKQLLDTTQLRAQARLDAVGSGIQVVAVELTDLSPPTQVREEFSAVQSAFIQSETQLKAAKEYRERTLPAARAERDAMVRRAEGEANALLAQARGEAAAFEGLVAEARGNRDVVTERLYRERIESTLDDAAKVRFIPPPVGREYTDFRVTLSGPR
jgi:membrane protease subunit HflK